MNQFRENFVTGSSDLLLSTGASTGLPHGAQSKLLTYSMCVTECMSIISDELPLQSRSVGCAFILVPSAEENSSAPADDKCVLLLLIVLVRRRSFN